MKRTLAIIFSTLLLFSGFLQAQPKGTEENLMETLKIYMGFVENKDMAGTLDYIHPALFEMVPREILQTAMEQAFSDTTVAISLHDAKINKIHDIISTDEGSYTLVDYSFVMDMKMNQGEDTADEEEGEEEEGEGEEQFDAMGMMISMLEMQYGEENVSFNEEEQLVTIKTEKTLYAILEPDFDSWKFLEKKDQMIGLFNKVIPEEVRKKLN